MEDKRQTCINIILVHGTFARNASWIRDGSSIHKYLSRINTDDDSPVSIHSMVWSGKNSRSARKDGAGKIKLVIEQLDAMDTSSYVYLIGHSHGGSAVAYFIKMYPSLRDRIAGAAFLSTPFIGLRVRHTAQTILVGLVVFFLVQGLINILMLTVIFPDNFLERHLTLSYALIISSTIVAAYATKRIWADNYVGRWHKLERSLGMRISETGTANIPSGNYLFVRATRDEAAALLAITQFIAWSTSIIEYLASEIVVYIYNMWTYLGRNRLGQTIKGIVFIMFALWATFFPIWLISGHWEYLWAFFISDFSVELGFGHADRLINAIFWIIWPLCNIILAIATIFVLSTTLLIVIGSLALIIFGWVNLTEAVFADLAIEPLPYGERKLFHLGWNTDYASDKLVLDHSLSYEHPMSLAYIGKWIVESHRHARRLEVAANEDQSPKI